MSGEDELLPDIEIDRHGLRTFRVRRGLGSRQLSLTSVVMNPSGTFAETPMWVDGVCVARCFKEMPITGEEGEERYPDHEAPYPGCNCGVYGAVDLASLSRQYFANCIDIITVIAAEGTTYLGSRGMRTAMARVVAFWALHTGYLNIAARDFPDAEHYGDLEEMLGAYEIPIGDLSPADRYAFGIKSKPSSSLTFADLKEL